MTIKIITAQAVVYASYSEFFANVGTDDSKRLQQIHAKTLATQVSFCPHKLGEIKISSFASI